MKVGDLVKIKDFRRNYITFEGAHDTLPVNCKLKETDNLLCLITKIFTHKDKPCRWLYKGHIAVGFLDTRQNREYYTTESSRSPSRSWCEIVSEA